MGTTDAHDAGRKYEFPGTDKQRLYGIINPRRKTPAFRHGDMRRVPFGAVGREIVLILTIPRKTVL
ncbi:MAG TPA: hypothetical protein VGN34_30305, partial [Ktedonobacteraceae bacterium]